MNVNPVYPYDYIPQQRRFSIAEKSSIPTTYSLSTDEASFCIVNGNTFNSKTKTGWIVIPSEKKSKQSLQENVDTFRILAPKKWHVNNRHIRHDLSEGDVHFYLENGNTKLGIKFQDDEISVINDESGNFRVSPKYYDIVDRYIREGNHSLSSLATTELRLAKLAKEEMDFFKEDRLNNVNPQEMSPEELLNACRISAIKNYKGEYYLSSYHEPGQYFTFEDLGIDPNKKFATIFKNLKEVTYNANFRGLNVKEFPNLERVGRNLNSAYSKIESYPKLEYVGGNADFHMSKIACLQKLKEVGGNANLSLTGIKTLERLKRVGGDLDFRDSGIVILPSLYEVQGNIDFINSPIEYLYSLERVDGVIKFSRISDSIQKTLSNNIFQYFVAD